MSNLFSKDEDLRGSPPVVGSSILKILRAQKECTVSIFDLVEKCKKEPWYSPKHLYLGLIFLYAIGAIGFDPPYVKRCQHD